MQGWNINPGKYYVRRTSPLTGKTKAMLIPLSKEDFEAAEEQWKAGALIQEAFPTLGEEAREFIMTGYTPADWKKMEASAEANQ